MQTRYSLQPPDLLSEIADLRDRIKSLEMDSKGTSEARPVKMRGVPANPKGYSSGLLPPVVDHVAQDGGKFNGDWVTWYTLDINDTWFPKLTVHLRYGGAEQAKTRKGGKQLPHFWIRLRNRGSGRVYPHSKGGNGEWQVGAGAGSDNAIYGEELHYIDVLHGYVPGVSPRDGAYIDVQVKQAYQTPAEAFDNNEIGDVPTPYEAYKYHGRVWPPELAYLSA